jgi:hypothetical protein
MALFTEGRGLMVGSELSRLIQILILRLGCFLYCKRECFGLPGRHVLMWDTQYINGFSFIRRLYHALWKQSVSSVHFMVNPTSMLVQPRVPLSLLPGNRRLYSWHVTGVSALRG